MRETQKKRVVGGREGKALGWEIRPRFVYRRLGSGRGEEEEEEGGSSSRVVRHSIEGPYRTMRKSGGGRTGGGRETACNSQSLCVGGYQFCKLVRRPFSVGHSIILPALCVFLSDQKDAVDESLFFERDEPGFRLFGGRERVPVSGRAV